MKFYPALNYKYGTQKWRMYDHLKMVCAASNADFASMHILRFGARLFEMRDDLEKYGWTIRMERLGNGLAMYHLERMKR